MSAIVRRGQAEQEESANRKSMREERLFSLLRRIRSSREDAADMIDTIKACTKNGLGVQCYNYLRVNIGVFGAVYCDGTEFKLRQSNGRRHEVAVAYDPRTDRLEVSSNYCGCLSAYSLSDPYCVRSVLGIEHDRYMPAIEDFAAKLSPYISGFFTWIDTL